MDLIDYRTLADEKADQFLKDNFPSNWTSADWYHIQDLIKTAFKVGYCEGHIDSCESKIIVNEQEK